MLAPMPSPHCGKAASPAVPSAICAHAGERPAAQAAPSAMNMKDTRARRFLPRFARRLGFVMKILGVEKSSVCWRGC
ncbi:hypothetical protein [Variovorax sp. UC74_104]|uniref:hypothetical protein n=1 Tax=Variovorax sp. UC74_104 TaxID=3374555 RepID=UPI003756D6C9